MMWCFRDDVCAKYCRKGFVLVEFMLYYMLLIPQNMLLVSPIPQDLYHPKTGIPGNERSDGFHMRKSIAIGMDTGIRKGIS